MNFFKCFHQFYYKNMTMRSLYIDDIPGARPKKHVYDKSRISALHSEEIQKFGRRNPQEKRVVQWYSPPKKPVEPMDRDDDNQWATKKTLKKSFNLGSHDMSRSIVLPRASSLNNMQPKMQQSSILTGSARKSLNMSNLSNVSDNPYFPHRYVDNNMGESNKWSGSRDWADHVTQVVHLTSTKDGYFRQWS